MFQQIKRVKTFQVISQIPSKFCRIQHGGLAVFEELVCAGGGEPRLCWASLVKRFTCPQVGSFTWRVALPGLPGTPPAESLSVSRSRARSRRPPWSSRTTRCGTQTGLSGLSASPGKTQTGPHPLVSPGSGPSGFLLADPSTVFAPQAPAGSRPDVALLVIIQKT